MDEKLKVRIIEPIQKQEASTVALSERKLKVAAYARVSTEQDEQESSYEAQIDYGIMALSTFFTGLSMKAKNNTDKCLKAFMMIHGLFYFSCTFMPMTGMFSKMSSGGDGLGGRLALVAWCVYFLPIGALSFLHFRER